MQVQGPTPESQFVMGRGETLQNILLVCQGGELPRETLQRPGS